MKADQFKPGTIFLDANENEVQPDKDIEHDEDNDDCKCKACELDKKEAAKWMKLFKAGGGVNPYPVSMPTRKP